jgi:hypothetical protein
MKNKHNTNSHILIMPPKAKTSTQNSEKKDTSTVNDDEDAVLDQERIDAMVQKFPFVKDYVNQDTNELKKLGSFTEKKQFDDSFKKINNYVLTCWELSLFFKHALNTYVNSTEVIRAAYKKKFAAVPTNTNPDEPEAKPEQVKPTIEVVEEVIKEAEKTAPQKKKGGRTKKTDTDATVVVPVAAPVEPNKTDVAPEAEPVVDTKKKAPGKKVGKKPK